MLPLETDKPSQLEPAPPEYAASSGRKYPGDGCLSRPAPNISNISLFPGNVAVIGGSFIMHLLLFQPGIDNSNDGSASGCTETHSSVEK